MVLAQSPHISAHSLSKSYSASTSAAAEQPSIIRDRLTMVHANMLLFLHLIAACWISTVSFHHASYLRPHPQRLLCFYTFLEPCLSHKAWKWLDCYRRSQTTYPTSSPPQSQRPFLPHNSCPTLRFALASCCAATLRSARPQI